MSISNSACERGFAELREMELATAREPDNLDLRLALAKAYLAGPSPQVAEAEICRLGRRSPHHPLVLSATIDTLVKKRAWSLLPLPLSAARTVVDPPIDLRLRLAKTHELLGHTREATAHYAAILDMEPFPKQAAGPLAEFACRHPGVALEMQRLLALAQRGGLDAYPPAMQYVAIRGCVESQPKLARRLLKDILFYQIDSASVVLDLAIQAFRLGRWAEAVASATHASTLCPQLGAAERLLFSGLCFQGRFSEAIERCRIDQSLPPMQLSREVLKTIRQLLLRQRFTERAFVLLSHNGDHHAAPEVRPVDVSSREDDDLFASPDSSTAAITVAIIHQAFGEPGLWDRIIEADLPGPMVVVQDVQPQPKLHGFILVEEDQEWPWQQMPLVVEEDADEDPGPAFEFVRAPTEAAPPANPRSTALWVRCLDELELISARKEPADDY